MNRQTPARETLRIHSWHSDKLTLRSARDPVNLEQISEALDLLDLGVDRADLLSGLYGQIKGDGDVTAPWRAADRVVEVRASRQYRGHSLDDPVFKVVVRRPDRFDLELTGERMGRFQKLDRRTMIHGLLQSEFEEDDWCEL